MKKTALGFTWKSPEDMTLEEKLGQMFVTGFPEGEMDDSFIRLVKEYKVGNVILFKENLSGREQIKGLCSDIQSLMEQETGAPAFITIDEEGGDCLPSARFSRKNAVGDGAVVAWKRGEVI